MQNRLKLIITFILLFITVGVYAQAQDQNFYLNDGKISWQKAYATEKSKEEVYAYFENSELFSVVKLEKNQVVAKLNPHAVDPNITGVAGVPPIVNKTDFAGDVMIEYRAKEKDYVVSFMNMVFVGRGDFLKKKERQAFEEQFVSKSNYKYRPGFLKRPKKVYNTTFTPLFEMP